MYNTEAEQEVLGILLIDPSLMAECSLKPKHFSPAHEPIFATMVRLGTFDIATVTDNHRKDATYITELQRNVVTIANFAYHCKLVKEAHEAEELRRIGTILIRNENPSQTVEVVKGELEQFGDEEKTESNGDTLKRMWKTIEKRSKSHDGVIGYRTGHEKLDRCLRGLPGGRNVIVGARAKMGKTAFVGGIVAEWVENKYPVGVFTFEMNREQWFERFTTQLAKPVSTGQNPYNYDRASHQRLHEATELIYKSDLHVYDFVGKTAEDTVRTIRQLKRKYGVELFVVDYLQRIRGTTGDDFKDVTRSSMLITDVAQELGVNIFTVAQLNRGNEDGAKPRRPRASDLRSSGQLEQDADAIILLHRPSAYNIDSQEDDEIIVDLNRHGPAGTIRAEFNGRHYEWREKNT